MVTIRELMGGYEPAIKLIPTTKNCFLSAGEISQTCIYGTKTEPHFWVDRTLNLSFQSLCRVLNPSRCGIRLERKISSVAVTLECSTSLVSNSGLKEYMCYTSVWLRKTYFQSNLEARDHN